jgi:recombinational DNA repair ATPase RecF
MRIRKVTAHAFGPLNGETLQFADGMTVITGDNESAKSSWHAAIFAGLCGRRRARGAPRREEQSFIDLHKPWDGGDWLVSGEVGLDDGRRIELRQDLAGKVDCHAKDLDVGTDVSAEVMNEGAPDGARWLGLDRSSFMATACIEQAQMLRVLDDADGLQTHLQRAADTAGADSTAASALSLIDEFERERVGRDWHNSTKPLRRAMDAVQDGGQRLEAARRAHQEYLRLAAEADRLQHEAESAEARVLAHEAAAARHEADELGRQVSRVQELRAALGDTPPASAAEDDALARRAAEAVARWQARPPEPVLTGPTVAQLQAEIDALPVMPDGDTEVHGSVTEAQTTLERAEAKLAQLEADRPSVPDLPAVAASASDQELLDIAHALEAPVPSVDPALEAAVEAARHDLDAAQSRGRVAAALLAAAGVAAVVAVALLASHNMGAGAGMLVLAVVVAILGVARRRGASPSDAQRRYVQAQAKIDAARQQDADAASRRDAAAQRCRELGLDPHPRVIRQMVADRARAAGYQADLAKWEGRVAGLQDQVRTAAAELQRALSARGHPPASPASDDLAAAVTEYRQACDRRAAQARQASRRTDLAAQLEARQHQERRTDTDRQEREAAATLVAAAAAACGLPAGPAETAAADLEKWLVQRSETTAAADKARQQAADLDALLNGRSPDELTQDAENTRRRTTELVARADPSLLAAADPATATERLPELRQEASDARVRAADATGGLRRYAASVPSVAEAEETLASAEAELGSVRQLQETLSLTRRFLTGAQDQVHRDIAPVLAATLRQWLPEITGGRYTDVIVDPATLQVQVCGESRRWRQAERLSYGTADQIYLLLRIALADHLTKSHDTCPLILDDVTVHADSARTTAILTLLLHISAERQVILFTQEDQVANWARLHLTSPDHAVRTLPALPPD